jgi:hypothetical protein
MWAECEGNRNLSSAFDLGFGIVSKERIVSRLVSGSPQLVRMCVHEISLVEVSYEFYLYSIDCISTCFYK